MNTDNFRLTIKTHIIFERGSVSWLIYDHWLNKWNHCNKPPLTALLSSLKFELIEISCMVQIYRLRLLFHLSPQKLFKISKKLNSESSAVTLNSKIKRSAPDNFMCHVIVWLWKMARTDGGVSAHLPVTLHTSQLVLRNSEQHS